MTLDGTRVLIVGGTSGLGLAVAQAAAAQGARPLVASRRQASVDRALGLLPAGAEGLTVDLTDQESVDHLGRDPQHAVVGAVGRRRASYVRRTSR